MERQFPSVFVLTNLTGRRASGERRVIIQTFDVPWRGVLVAMAAFLPGLVVTFMFWPLLGNVAIMWVPVVEIGAFWLVEGRRRSGLHLRNYQAILDRKRSTEGKFFMCGAVIDPGIAQRGTVRLNTVAVKRADPYESIDAAIDEQIEATPHRRAPRSKRSLTSPMGGEW